MTFSVIVCCVEICKPEVKHRAANLLGHLQCKSSLKFLYGSFATTAIMLHYLYNDFEVHCTSTFLKYHRKEFSMHPFMLSHHADVASNK